MNDKEKLEAQKEANEKRLAAIKKRKEAEIKAGFLNPLGEATSYAEFLAEVEKSKKSVAEYCKDKLTAEELAWLSIEIEHFKNNQKD